MWNAWFFRDTCRHTMELWLSSHRTVGPKWFHFITGPGSLARSVYSGTFIFRSLCSHGTGQLFLPVEQAHNARSNLVGSISQLAPNWTIVGISLGPEGLGHDRDCG